MSIVYSNYSFTEPMLLSTWVPTYASGIYAILKPNPLIAPRPYEVIYFGESSNFSERGFPWNHHKANSWMRNALSKNNIYISTYLMPYSTTQQRQEVEAYLIQQYKPACNDYLPFSPSF